MILATIIDDAINSLRCLVKVRFMLSYILDILMIKQSNSCLYNCWCRLIATFRPSHISIIVKIGLNVEFLKSLRYITSKQFCIRRHRKIHIVLIMVQNKCTLLCRSFWCHQYWYYYPFTAAQLKVLQINGIVPNLKKSFSCKLVCIFCLKFYDENYVVDKRYDISTSSETRNVVFKED